MANKIVSVKFLSHIFRVTFGKTLSNKINVNNLCATVKGLIQGLIAHTLIPFRLSGLGL